MKSKTTAALLAFFLGGIGGHKFYLGQTGMGLLYLFFSWTFIPLMVSFVEFIMLLVMGQQEFDSKFNLHAMLAHGAPNQIAQSVVVNMPGNGDSASDVGAQIAKLNELRVSGALTEEEFSVQKQKLLSS